MSPRSTTLFTARFVLPVATEPLEQGALLAVGARIKAVGRLSALSADYPGVPVVDFGDAALLPPMVNAHTHLELTSFPAWAAVAEADQAGQDFVDWVLSLIKVRRSVSTAQVADSLAIGLKESMRFGTGAIGDICTTLDAIDAFRQTPIYGRVFAEVLGHATDVVSARLEAIRVMLGRPPAKALNWGLAPHAPYTLSAAAMDQVFAFSAEHSLQNTIHLAESAAETRFVKEGRGIIAEKLFSAAQWDPAGDPVAGCSPVQALCRAGRLRRNDLVVHGVQVGKADIVLLKQTGCHIVLCPRSNAALQTGKAPVADYLLGDVPLSLGTDSLASAPSLSLWDELAFARSWFAGDAPPRKWLQIATQGGARALGLQDRIGQLAVGCEASFQVVKLPDLPGLAELEEALCSAGEMVKVTNLYLAARNVLPER